MKEWKYILTLAVLCLYCIMEAGENSMHFLIERVFWPGGEFHAPVYFIMIKNCCHKAAPPNRSK